jgi:hypothetical protein
LYFAAIKLQARVADKLGLCPTHYDEYEEVRQEIIQDDYYL